MSYLKKTKMSMRRLAAVSFLAVPLAACQTATGAKFHAGRPVESQSKAGGNAYLQDNEPLDMSSLLDGIEAVPSAREDAQSARGWSTMGTVLGGLGGAGIGWGLVSGVRGEQYGWYLAGGGAALAAVALLTIGPGGESLDRAIKAYNASLRPVSQTPRVAPWAVVTSEPGGKHTGAIGLSGTF